MGGPGSGRRLSRTAVHEARCLDIGELCDAGRLQAHPRGEVSWWGELENERRGGLRYRIGTRALDGEQILTLERSIGPDQVLVLDVVAGKATCALCPWCGQPARKLYVLAGQRQFRCWRCSGLVYRSHTKPAARWLSYQRQFANPVLDLVADLPQRVRHRPWRTYVEAPAPELAAELAGELPLGYQELRLWCLRLRQVGLSYRQIARLTESSKSTVSRLCLEGRAGIQLSRLIDEREEREQPRWPLDRALYGANDAETRTVTFLADD
jgi:hypothetical protein